MKNLFFPHSLLNSTEFNRISRETELELKKTYLEEDAIHARLVETLFFGWSKGFDLGLFLGIVITIGVFLFSLLILK